MSLYNNLKNLKEDKYRISYRQTRSHHTRFIIFNKQDKMLKGSPFQNLKVLSDTYFVFYFFSLKKNTFESRKMFLFCFKSSFCSCHIQILEFQSLKFHDVMICLTMKHEMYFTWEVNTVY